MITFTEIHQVAMHDTRPHTPPSPAVNAVRKQSIQDAQSLLDPVMLIQSTAGTPTSKNDEQQQFPAISDSSTCDSMALPKNINEQPRNIEFQGTPEKENSHLGIEQIVMRSPAKPILRIEDSVEAIDAFEEAIEKVGELIPAITKDHISTAKAKKQRKVVAQPEASNRNTNASTHTIESSASTKSVITRSSSRNPAQKSRAPSLRQTNNLSTMKSTMERTSGINGGSVAPSAKSTNASPSSPMATVSKPRAVSTKRVSSIHKAPFQPVKSTKPPTRPSFELPGDAVARKLKEQREERLKRGEGEAPKKEAFKARPVRLSSAPVVKGTATSRARISMAKLDVGQLIASNNRAPTTVPGVRSGSISTTNSAKRFSTPSIPKKDTIISSHGANYTASHPPSKEVKMSKNSNELSRGDISVSDMAQQKQRGKEVFNRTRVEQDERERAKREKEEAARKARAEAAERGRIASREWAEKQKLKKNVNDRRKFP